MINKAYSRAYKEVVTIIGNLNDDEYMKIPKEKIDFYKNNMDKEYNFTYDSNLTLNEQNISIETKAIIVSLFTKCFANETQKDIVKNRLKENYIKSEEEKEKKYGMNNLFKSNNAIKEDEQILIVERQEKNNFLINIINKVIRIFKK